MVHGASLTDNDVTGYSCLTTEDFNPEPFALGIPAVLYTTFTFLCAIVL